MENKGAQGEADKHCGENVADHAARSLNDGQTLCVDACGAQRVSECVDVDAVVLRSVGASVDRQQLLLRACVHIEFDCVCHRCAPVVDVSIVKDIRPLFSRCLPLVIVAC